jgi:hypothetical protein
MVAQRRGDIMSRLRLFVASLGVLVFASIPSMTVAQSVTGIIAGVVKDASGAVMPGVTVEAVSPVLIEKVRTAVTDGRGEYKIVDLRPGTYTVTFTLTGFSTVKRNDLEVTAAVTLNASAELSVGELSETVTVSGQSALVDTQNTNQHRTISTALIEGLPTSKQVFQMTALMPGVIVTQNGNGGSFQDVGGVVGDKQPMLSVHGSNANEMPLQFDGMKYSTLFNAGGGNSTVWVMNSAMVQEVSIDTSGAGADAQVSGVRVNAIPKQGGNKWSGYFLTNYANNHLQANNITPELTSVGATPYVTNLVVDVNPALGGPIRQNKLWFYGSFRYWKTEDVPSGAHIELTPGNPIYTPDPNVSPTSPSRNTTANLRLTWQTSKNSKLAVYGDAVDRCTCAIGLSATTAYYATREEHTPINHLFQVTWNWVASSRLLFEIGQTYLPQTYCDCPHEGADAFPTITDNVLGVTYNGTGSSTQASRVQNGKFLMTFVTGSHNLKVGSQWLSGRRYLTTTVSGPNNYTETFNNGKPSSLTQRTTPIVERENVGLDLGIFAQEQWTVKKLTLNAGVRFDHLRAYIPAQDQPPAALAPQYGERVFPKYDDLPNWNDISPRMGLSYDLRGNGKTAVKWNLGRYVGSFASNIAALVNPMSASSTSASRTWNDVNGNFIPDCDLTNPAANGRGGDQCGVINNASFGSPALTTQFDPKAITGWGVRPYNWEMMVGIQHELFPGVAVDASLNRRWYNNFLVTANQALTPADFNPYCITTPSDSRLPGGGNQQVCGLYDVTPAKFGQVNNVVTQASTYGDMTMVYNGFDVHATARLPRGALLQGGTSTGHTSLNDCGVVMNHPEVTTVGTTFLGAATAPREIAFCDVNPPLLTQVKLLGVYPLPWWSLQTSMTFQTLREPQEGASGIGFPGILANLTVPNSAIAPSLGRNLSAGVSATVTTPIVPAGTLYGDRLYQVDFRISKAIVRQGMRIQPSFDLYNLFNNNAILTVNNTYGPNWQHPVFIMAGRLAKFGVQVSF